MDTKIFNSKKELGAKAAFKAAKNIKEAIKKNGQANIILATGASQFETLKSLVEYKDIDWSKVVVFHLDEYVGMPDTHPASFRKYLKERFIEKVKPLKEVYLIEGDQQDLKKECDRLGQLISVHPIDVALVGIGENCHLAFNDPPADFDTEEPYLVVDLDEACRLQQMGEGWFDSMEEVPEQAISMSIKQIMKSKIIICSVPDERKAKAVKDCLEGEVSNLHPASILQQHPNCTVYLDSESASLIADIPESVDGSVKAAG
jgi:glucosamine-6-phosphate deaminase